MKYTHIYWNTASAGALDQKLFRQFCGFIYDFDLYVFIYIVIFSDISWLAKFQCDFSFFLYLHIKPPFGGDINLHEVMG